MLLGQATATTLKIAILGSFKIDGLELKQLLMLDRNSSFVSLSLKNIIENEMKKSVCNLLKFSNCHLHSTHNSFKAGNYRWFLDK